VLDKDSREALRFMARAAPLTMLKCMAVLIGLAIESRSSRLLRKANQLKEANAFQSRGSSSRIFSRAE
jgi:hypothetical protein